MNILTIGDIHGRNNWKDILFSSVQDYEIWRTAIDNGGDPIEPFWNYLPFKSCDKIIFIGDYVDSFNVKNVAIKHNLCEIIHLKQKLGDRVVLLLGNHDIQYILNDQICSGYRSEARPDLFHIFTENIDLFKMAHEEVDSEGNHYLWTHAGVTYGWFDLIKTVLTSPMFRFKKIVDEFDIENKSVADIINLAWEFRVPALFFVDVVSGGYEDWAGPVWVRPYVLRNYVLEGYNQIVGHTPQPEICVINSQSDDTPFEYFKIYLVDVLERTTDALKLQID